ncbi:MAG: c-type cytochrome [Novosphingobium sp.]
MRLQIPCLLLVLLTACNQPQQQARALTPEQSAALRPADARVASLYEQSCKACHTVRESNAPLAGDRTLWDPRWQNGEDALLASVVQGKGGMPAGGQCFSCSPEDLRVLIRFMAGRGER